MSYPLLHPHSNDPAPAFLDVAAFHTAFAGESQYVEFKKGVSTGQIQKAAVAFSNTDGGVIIVGVAPDGMVTGVQNPGEWAKDIHHAFRQIANPGRYDVRELPVGAHLVLVTAIQRRQEGFAQMPNGAVLVRRGASNTALLGADLSTFLSRRAFARFEATPTKFEIAEIDPALRQRLSAAYAWDDDDDLETRFEESGFITREAQANILTVAGALLLLQDPKRMGGRPYIDIRRYAADEADPDRTWEIGGPVDDQIVHATALISAELGTVSAILGARRVELPRLPERALREAVANAVAHRSYESAGTAVRIDIRPSHMTVVSPGGLPEPVTIEHIRDQQAARNDCLLRALRRLHLAEDQGEGIDRIEDDMARDLLHAPEFTTDGSSFSVTLRLDGVVTPRERAWVRTLIGDDQIDPRSTLVIVDVARHGSVTNSEIRSLLDIDSVDARAILQGLVRSNILTQVGERGGAEYRLSSVTPIDAGIRHTNAELDELAMALADDAPLTNTRLREETGLDAAQARKVFRRLLDQGRLLQRGSRRGTRYEIPDR